MKVLLAVLLSFSFFLAGAQNQRDNSGALIGLDFSVGLHRPGGDWAARFGDHGSLGSSVEYFFKKSNFILGLEGYFLFGQKVKEDVLAGIRGPDGLLISNDRSVADIQLRERGFYVGGHLGKLFRLSDFNPKTGIRLTVGAGVLQHQIRLQEEVNVSVSAISGDYKKGYDRLSNGLALNQFIGYQHFSLNRRINFYAGFEFTQAFTQSRRDYNFDTRSTDADTHFDWSYGLRLGWVFPFYLSDKGEEILY